MKSQIKTSSDEICYICKKIIKNKPYYSIGKNKNGLELYRHKKCYVYNLSKAELDKVKNWTSNPEIIIKKRRKRKIK